MKRSIISIIFLLFVGVHLQAQYSIALGLRSGGTSGFTVKAKPAENYAYEGIVGIWNDGLSFTGLYERQPSFLGLKRLRWMLGAGAHAGFYGNNYRGTNPPAWYRDNPEDIDNGEIGIGIDAKFGMEYKIPVIPIAFSIEFKPFVEFTSAGQVWFSFDPGLGMKVAF